MNSNLLTILLFQFLFSLIISQQISPLTYGPIPIRSMKILNDGIVLGGRSSGHEIEVWVSSNHGLSWTKRGSVANNPNIDYGDLMLLAIPRTNIYN